MASSSRVRDIFIVRQGVHTGKNEVFLLPEAEFLALPEAERPFFRPAIINGSIVGGVLRSTTFVFYPYGDAQLDSEEEVRARVPTFYAEHLSPWRDELIERQRKSADDWWELAEPRAWQVAIRPKVVSTYFGDAGSFAFDEDGSHVVVQGYAWLPHESITRVSAFAYVALLNSPIFSDLLAASSNNVGSGAWNLSKRFVEDIPIPIAVDLSRDVLEGLAAVGQRIASEGLSSLSGDESRALREFSRAAYNA
jgi:hypothetical protein